MVVSSTNMKWLSELSHVGDNLRNSLSWDHKKTNTLGILAFETAKTMSRLVSLYRSVSEDEINNLRYNLVRAEGVKYLNSNDEGFLLSLACAERLEDLDKVASAVARLGHKCDDFGLKAFDLVYSDLKLGLVDFRDVDYYGVRETEYKVKKMEKLIVATSTLHASLGNLKELEVSENKINEWKKVAPVQVEQVHFDQFLEKIEYQRRQVRHLKEVSLWNKTFDKSVALMGRIVCIVYSRIYTVFGPYVPIVPGFSLSSLVSSLPRATINVDSKKSRGLIEPIKDQKYSRSGPIKYVSNPTLIRFYSRRSVFFRCDADKTESGKVFKKKVVSHAAGPSTVGGKGLGLRYANLVLLAQKCLDSGGAIHDNSRDYIYNLLPQHLKNAVNAKLRKNLRRKAEYDAESDEDEMIADGWRDALRELMRWLVPMAENTIKWQLERNVVKMKFDWKPSVLLFQTLHFADKERAEATIAEILVGLSCIYKFENQISYEYELQ